jgi:hypothetical protein
LPSELSDAKDASEDILELAARLLPADRQPRTVPEALDALAELYAHELSHARDCPVRHCGECLCVRGELAQLLERQGLDV